MIKRIHIENFKSIQGKVTIDLKPIKAATIKAGEKVEGCSLVERRNMSIS